jgi:hypothetical protein
VRLGARLALFAIAGCADPSVEVAFTAPDGYRDLIEAVALEVLASEMLDCDQIALGNASGQELATSLVAEALVRADGESAALSGIPRTGRKLLVARATGASGQLVAAGCAQLDTVEGDREVVITGEPALTLSGRDQIAVGPLPDELVIVVSDAHGQPIEGVVGLQTVVDADSEVVGEPATSGRGGVMRFQVEQPTWAGPQVVDVDLRWQANQRDQFAGFKSPFDRYSAVVPSPLVEETLPTRALYQVGRIGPAGEVGVAVLGRATPEALRPVHIYYPDGDDLVAVTSEELIDAETIGLVADGAREQVVAMNRDLWFEIAADGAVTSQGLPGLVDAVDLAPVGDCTAGAPRDQLLAVSTGQRMALFESDGSRVEDWSGGAIDGVRGLLAAGCIRGGDEVFRAAVYLARPDGGEVERPIIAVESAGAQPTVVTSAIARGLSFSPVGGEGPFLLSNRFELDGSSVARYTVVPLASAPTFLDQQAEDETAGLAESTAAGDFDGDGLLDVAALLLVPTGEERGSVIRFFIVLGKTVEEERLVGLGVTGLADDEVTPHLVAADFDGDGVDELVVATPSAFTVYSLEP